MNELDKAIEGYNKEKFVIQSLLTEKACFSHDSKYNFFRERLTQIDNNIERLLSLKFYPEIKK